MVIITIVEGMVISMRYGVKTVKTSWKKEFEMIYLYGTYLIVVCIITYFIRTYVFKRKPVGIYKAIGLALIAFMVFAGGFFVTQILLFSYLAPNVNFPLEMYRSPSVLMGCISTLIFFSAIRRENRELDKPSF